MSRDLLFGAHSVNEWLDADPRRIEAVLVLEKRNDRLEQLVAKARENGVTVEPISRHRLHQLAGPRNPQGVAARVRPFAFKALEDVVANTPADQCVLLFVDGVTDPGNLGALIRSAAFFGVSAVVLPKDRSASITPVVERSAAGGVARIPICQVNSLLGSLQDVRAQGFSVLGTIPGPHPEPSSLELGAPLAVVVGSEDKGIRPSVRKLCDKKASLRSRGLQSLNVSACTAIVLYEIFRGPG